MIKTLATLVTHALPEPLNSRELDDSDGSRLWHHYVLSLLSGSGMADDMRGDDFPEYLLLEKVMLPAAGDQDSLEAIEHLLRKKLLSISFNREFQLLLACVQSAYEKCGRSPAKQAQVLVATRDNSQGKYWVEARGVQTHEGMVVLIQSDGSPWLAHNPFTQSQDIKPREIDEDQPEAILLPLLQSLAEADFERFAQFWTPGNTEDNLRQRYVQFLRVYEACNGLLTFDGYDPNQRPELYPECRQVRMYITRHFSNGEKGRSPLVMVRENGQWALFRGSI